MAESRSTDTIQSFVGLGWLARVVLVLMPGLITVQSAIAETVLWSSEGTSAHEHRGIAIAVGSDISGDGIPDVAVGSLSNGSGPGMVTVRSGASGSLLYTLTGSINADYFGQHLDYVPDVDGDSIKDLVVAAPGAFNTTLNAYVRMFSGVDGSVLWTNQSSFQADLWGSSVRYAGDVNNDGIADVVFGAPLLYTNSAPQGLVTVVSGSDGSFILYRPGLLYNSNRLGENVAGVGDINGDGYDDFVATTMHGYALAWFSGQTGNVIRTTCIGPQSYPSGCVSGLGGPTQSAIVSMGDLSGDGVPDTAIAGDSVDYGVVVVRSGASDSVIRVLAHRSQADGISNTIKNIGDQDGDGFDDMLVSSVGVTSGRFIGYSGKTGATLFSYRGPSTGDQFGIAVDSPGDVDGDGVIDVLVGANLFDNTYTNAGRVQMITGIRMVNSCSYLWLDSDVPACLL